MLKISYIENSEQNKEVPDGFLSCPWSDVVVASVFRYQRAKKRSGNHAVRSRGQVKRSTRKLGDQKRRGMARVGDAGSPIRRGGGVAMGPVVRSHAFKLPKKVRQLALHMVLSRFVANDQLKLCAHDQTWGYKTKDMKDWLKRHELTQKGAVLFVSDGAARDDLLTISRNLHDVNVLPVIGLNVCDLLHHKTVVILDDVWQKVLNRLGAEELC